MRLRSGIKTEASDHHSGSQGDFNTSTKGMTDINKTVGFGKYKFNYTILLVHFNIFLYSTCFWIQQGVFPYLSSKLGSGSVVYGYLQTTFALVQLCGGPIFGRVGDLYGGRSALTLAFLCSSLSYAILGFADSITLLFVSRLPSLFMHAMQVMPYWDLLTASLLFVSRLPSLFMHAMQGGQMVVTDLAKSEERAAALGKLAISYGIGMVLGPFVGGQLAKFYGEQNAAFVACAGSLLSALMCFTQIPPTTKRSAVQTTQEQTKDAESKPFSLKESLSVLDPRKYLSIIKHERAFVLLIVRFITGIPIGIFQSMFQMVAKDQYGLDAEYNGYMMSYIGILSMIVQGLGMGILRKKLTETQLIKLGIFVLIWAYLALGFVQTIWQLVICLAPLTFGLAVLTIVISAALTNSVDDQDTGAILGINMAVNSMIRTVSPTMGGYILEWYGFSAFGYIGFIDSLLVFIYVFIKFRGQ